MKLAKRVLPLSLVAALMLALAANIVSAQQPPLTSVKVTTPPVLDGTVDAVWSQATEVSVPISGGANMASSTVGIKSVYTADSIYFLVHYADPTESLMRQPWEKQADGTWKKLKGPGDPAHRENTYYEDKFAFIWNSVGTPGSASYKEIKNFASTGCFTVCHLGEPAASTWGSKYTASATEAGDIWHWKSVRTGPVNQVDDQYVDDARAPASAEAGRHSDAKTAGGYVDNQNTEKTAPASGAAANKPAPPYWILDKDKVALDSAAYKTGDKVAGIVTAPFTGDRGDISSGSAYRNGHWYLEIGRKLITGSATDVQFTDLTKPYYFGVAAFDNAQVEHAYQGGATQLAFQAAAPAATATPAAPLPKVGDTIPGWAWGTTLTLIALLVGGGAALLRRRSA